MNERVTPLDAAPVTDPAGSAPIALEQLVMEAYAASGPQTRQHMLAKLVGKVFDSAPAYLQTRLLEQLLRPVGFMPLILIANGLFAKIRFRGGWTNPLLRPVDLQAVRGSDIVPLVEQVLQTGGNALNGVIHLLLHSPALAGSGAATVLVALLLQNLQPLRENSMERRATVRSGAVSWPRQQWACQS